MEDNIQSVRENSSVNIAALIKSESFGTQIKDMIIQFVKENILKAREQTDQHESDHQNG